MKERNEKTLVESICNHEGNVRKAIEHIREAFNVDGEYNFDDSTIRLTCEDSANNAMALAQAKQYIESTIGEDMIQVVF